MICAGETFLWRGNAYKEHLYIVLNSAATCAGKVALVNLTESKGGPMAMVLKTGDHPYIYKNSDVNFGDSFVADEVLIVEQMAAQLAFPNAPMDLALVERIARTALKHPAVERCVKRLLEKQWP